MERRKFTREFKLEAVRLIKERGVSSPQSTKSAARSTCTHQNRREKIIRAER
jgi:transposase